MTKTDPSLPTVLTIAGSDSSSGAGVQGDLKAIHALGGYALTVPTAITSQNSQGVSAAYSLPKPVIEDQLNAVLSDYHIHAIKIGMLGSLDALETVIQQLKKTTCRTIVLDPVLISSSGHPLLEKKALPIFINELLPLVSLITPNLPEVNTLLNKPMKQFFVGKEEEMPEIAQALFSLGIQAAVIKGGHSAETLATDYLVQPSHNRRHPINIQSYSTERLETTHTHGTGCTYASAIATELAKGKGLEEAIKNAKAYLFSALMNADKAQPCYPQTHNKSKQPRKGGLNHFSRFNRIN